MRAYRSVLAFASAAALLVAAPAALQAQTCGGNAFKTCASVSVSTTKISQTGSTSVWEIVMNVANMAGSAGTYAGTVFTSMGVWGLSRYSYVSNSFTATGSGSWSYGTNGLSGAGIQSAVAGGSANPSPIKNGLHAGQSVLFKFRISGRNLSPNVNNWALHGQSGPMGCSTKLVVTGGTANNGPYDDDCGVDPTTGIQSTTTPEPASMILLGTGLVGVAGAAKRRRNRVQASANA